jgi:hypothetical protein
MSHTLHAHQPTTVTNRLWLRLLVASGCVETAADVMADQLRDCFPYPPYDIQLQFMINVVDTLEKKQIGLFESPTGDANSFHLMCHLLVAGVVVLAQRLSRQKLIKLALQERARP